MTPPEIEGLMAEMQQPKYRADQVFGWLHQKNIGSFAAMENLPLSLRNSLEEKCVLATAKIVDLRVSSRDGTVKFLTEMNATKPAFVESVLMKYKHGHSVCISTQAGCRMGCKFCASAESGFQRNLTAGEYCAQIYAAARELGDTGRISSVVLMGCGEPLDNLDATLRFIELITHPKGMNLGQRHITLSTCGLVPQIYELAKLRLQVTLAVSLHAPTDDIREAMMPIAQKYPLRELLPACRNYAETTRRRITFEYALAKGVNSESAHAKALAKLLRGLLCHVNLIPINKARGEFSPATRNEIESFAEILKEANIPVTVRRSLGGDVDAACGQLRARRVAKK